MNEKQKLMDALRKHHQTGPYVDFEAVAMRDNLSHLHEAWLDNAPILVAGERFDLINYSGSSSDYQPQNSDEPTKNELILAIINHQNTNKKMPLANLERLTSDEFKHLREAWLSGYEISIGYNKGLKYSYDINPKNYQPAPKTEVRFGVDDAPMSIRGEAKDDDWVVFVDGKGAVSTYQCYQVALDEIAIKIGVYRKKEDALRVVDLVNDVLKNTLKVDI